MRQKRIIRLALVLSLIVAVIAVARGMPDPEVLAPAYFVMGNEVAPSHYYAWLFFSRLLPVFASTWLMLTLASWIIKGFAKT